MQSSKQTEEYFEPGWWGRGEDCAACNCSQGSWRSLHSLGIGISSDSSYLQRRSASETSSLSNTLKCLLFGFFLLSPPSSSSDRLPPAVPHAASGELSWPLALVLQEVHFCLSSESECMPRAFQSFFVVFLTIDPNLITTSWPYRSSIKGTLFIDCICSVMGDYRRQEKHVKET